MSDLAEAVSLLASRVSTRPRVAVILGSGLGSAVGEIEGRVALPYEAIPGFPCTTVPGHQGELVVGTLEGTGIVAMKGRPHLYEGFSLAQMAFPVRLLEALGVDTLVVTNAAGGLDPALEPGVLMLLKDHINLPGMMGMNPLIAVAGGQERFVPMVAAYDRTLREWALEAARGAGIRVAEGVYAMVMGPNYETDAEARFLRQVGADAVGMSTVPEVLVARWLGMRVLGISCITNVLLRPEVQGGEGHSGVLAVAEAAAADIALLLRSVLRRIQAAGE